MRKLILIACFVVPTAAAIAQGTQTPPPASVPPRTGQAGTPPAVGPQNVNTPPPQGRPQGQQGQGQQGRQGQGQPGQGPQGRGQTPPATLPPGQATNVPPAVNNWQNVKLDVTITDTLSADIQSKRTVSMIIMDGRSGQIRSTGGDGLINIDARPAVRPDGRIAVQITIEYRPELTPQQAQQSGSSRITLFSESLSLMVQDGRPIIASQSSDPQRGDRKVAIEILATVQK